ncbi:MAG: proteasome accessory factor PafA2 family protein [Fimbriimonadaceae bacterium]|nr:proteasome accessory factor PafA2 family protein [Fimbriimonadaceae bacterium]
MARGAADRIIGIETEFGTLVQPGYGAPEGAVEAIKDHVFHDLKLGAIDLLARDEVFEPAESGGFLMNGGRLYIDAVGSHLEYATAECRSLRDLVAQDRAGQRLIVRSLQDLGVRDVVDVYNNSIDHFGGHTFGCHENYLVKMDEDFISARTPGVIGFLVTRQIFAGTGRVGGHILAATGRPNLGAVSANPIDYIWVSQIYHALPDDSVEFQLSQRADHILKTVASRVRFNRALINPKWEHFYSHDGMNRFHLLFGEANQSEYAMALKVGTTSLVLRLAEEGRIPERLILDRPLVALRQVSRDRSYRWPVCLADGTSIGAVDYQREFLSLALGFRGESEETDWILTEWESVLDQLSADPLQLGDRLDWVAKLHVLEAYREDAGVGWDDPALHSVDLEYHNIDPAKSLFHAIDCRRIVSEANIALAQVDPPNDTRALGRSKLVRSVVKGEGRSAYLFDWSGVTLDRGRYLEMPDPFQTYASEADALLG